MGARGGYNAAPHPHSACPGVFLLRVLWGVRAQITAPPQGPKALALVDADSAAFDAVMNAAKLADNTPEAKRAKEEAMSAALKHAVTVPLATMELGADPQVWSALIELAKVRACAHLRCMHRHMAPAACRLAT